MRRHSWKCCGLWWRRSDDDAGVFAYCLFAILFFLFLFFLDQHAKIQSTSATLQSHSARCSTPARTFVHWSGRHLSGRAKARHVWRVAASIEDGLNIDNRRRRRAVDRARAFAFERLKCSHSVRFPALADIVQHRRSRAGRVRERRASATACSKQVRRALIDGSEIIRVRRSDGTGCDQARHDLHTFPSSRH